MLPNDSLRLPTDIRVPGLTPEEIGARVVNRIRVRVLDAEERLPLPVEAGAYMFRIEEPPNTILPAMGLDPDVPPYDASTTVYKVGKAPGGIGFRSGTLMGANGLISRFSQAEPVLVCFVVGFRPEILTRFESGLKRAMLQYRLPVGGDDFEHVEFVFANAGQERALINIFRSVANEFIDQERLREVGLARQREVREQDRALDIVDLTQVANGVPRPPPEPTQEAIHALLLYKCSTRHGER